MKLLSIICKDGSVVQLGLDEVDYIAIDKTLFDNGTFSRSIRLEKIGIRNESFICTDSMKHKKE